MLKAGDKAPDFVLPTLNEKNVDLLSLRGKKVVLYFYPKDNTPGCTLEACAFRDSMGRLSALGVEVLGVSRDDLVSHQKFANRFDLSFPLLSDTEGEVSKKYDCWQEKSMFGKKYFGIERCTFLIDEEGMIRKVWRKVKVSGHVDEVLKAVEKLG